MRLSKIRINSSGCALSFVDDAPLIARPVFLFFVKIQLVAAAPRVSSVASYSGVTMRSFRCGTVSGVGAGEALACTGAGVAVATACAVGEAEGDADC